jgi:hypothetical protein
MEASQPRTVARHSGPVVIGYDGSDAARHAIRETGALLPGRAAVVVVVWKQGLGFELMELPAATIGMPPAMLDVRTALEIDRELAQSSERLAQQGADVAMGAGLEAQGLAVADDPDVPIAETIVRVARERDRVERRQHHEHPERDHRVGEDAEQAAEHVQADAHPPAHLLVAEELGVDLRLEQPRVRLQVAPEDQPRAAQEGREQRVEPDGRLPVGRVRRLQRLGQHGRRERQRRRGEQQADARPLEPAVHVLDAVEDGVVVQPDDGQVAERRDVGQIARPLVE